MDNAGGRNRIKHRGAKLVFAVLVLLSSLALFAFVFYLFLNVGFIPKSIVKILLVLCVAAALLSVWFFAKYVEYLNQK